MKVIFIVLLIGMIVCTAVVVFAVLTADYEKLRKQNNKRCYLCDPDKNTSCRKTACQEECFYTTYPKYAVLDTEGNPIVTYDPEKEKMFHEGKL